MARVLLSRDFRSPSSEEGRPGSQLPVLTLLLSALRRSALYCIKNDHEEEDINKMEIGWPDNVRHVAHVTFDRFKGFLGLPAEFQLEIPIRVPSASVSVFGVSAESMQCSYDERGNSVPVILLSMQARLYEQGGLKAEGIFRINPENTQEEHVRGELNKGIVPQDVDVHCLAGLIKAWFRELPAGVLDSLSPEKVMECHTQEQSIELVKLLPPTQFALLDWAVNLMADVAQYQDLNKMNARNIAMVFAPNMTQMSDPLTALMHAVQVMNMLKDLILKVIRDREEAVLDPRLPSSCQEPDLDGNHRGEGDGEGHYVAKSTLSHNRIIEEEEEEDSQAVEEMKDVLSPEAEVANFPQHIEESPLSTSYSGLETVDEDEDDISYNGSSTDDDYSNGLEMLNHSTDDVAMVETFSESPRAENVKFISQENELQEYVQVQYSLFDQSLSKGRLWDGSWGCEIDQNNEMGRSLVNL